MSKVEINLSERDTKRLLKYFVEKLDSLEGDRAFDETCIEFYNEEENVYDIYDKKILNSLKRNLAIIKNDIKMFEKLKKVLEVK